MLSENEISTYLDWASKHPNKDFSQIAWHIIASQIDLELIKYPDPDSLIEPDENKISKKIVTQVGLEFLLLRLLNGQEDAINQVGKYDSDDFFGTAGILLNILILLNEYKVNDLIIKDEFTSKNDAKLSKIERKKIEAHISQLIILFDQILRENYLNS